MRLEILSIIILNLLSLSLSAQTKTDSVRWSPVFSNRTTPTVVARDDSSFYLVYEKWVGERNTMTIPTGKYQYWVGRMDKDLNHQVKSRIKLPRHSRFQFIKVIENKIYFFSTDTVHKETVLNAQLVNRKSLQLEPPIPVIRFNGTFELMSFGNSRSPDSSKLVVYALTTREKTANLLPRRCRFWVLDNHLKLLTTNINPITFPTVGEVFETDDVHVDNDGNVFILGRLYANRKDWSKSSEPGYINYNRGLNYLSGSRELFVDYKYYFAVYPINGNERHRPIDAGVFIDKLHIAISNHQEVFLTGFYADDFKSKSIGFIALKVDRNSEVFRYKKLYPYGTLVMGILPETVWENNYLMRDGFNAFPMNDGSLILVEKFSVNPVFANLTYPPHIIAAVSFSPSGDVKWEHAFAVKRYWDRGVATFTTWAEERKYASGYIDRTSNRNLIMISYNDRSKDELKRTTISADGTLQTQVLMHNNELKPMLGHSNVYADSMIVMRRHRQYFQVGKLKIR